MRSPTRSLSSSCLEPFNPSSTGLNHKRTHSHPHALVEVPDWEDKPSPEEYKLLSSKEKRQLRNKISARNFRHRRKEHISTLEQQLINRDQLIDSLKNELNQTKSDNLELKSEIEHLKTKWSDLMKKIEEMSLGVSITSTSNTQQQPLPQPPLSPKSRPPNKSNMILQFPNLHKDVGTHTRKPFNGVGGMTSGGNVGVHTTLIPEIPIDVYRNPLITNTESTPKPMAQITFDSNTSPQSLIEQKLYAKSVITARPTTTTNSIINLGAILNSLSINDNLFNLDSTKLTQSDRIECLSKRLNQVIIEAFKSHSSNDTSTYLDEDKLIGCLDGRLQLQVVESSPPPPYMPSSPTTTTTTTIDHHLSRQFSRFAISEPTPA
ncbi:hypothetical protein CROQUDRAFT_35117 [Cronartium quercuum f. sp. fusiforme G11]|uniref:BZIP domain-containing protein n=1 Tax=Cronartium quercuum f. sp. fusiforme G11 TaxID=708437 RepID=A0A9P6NVB7_9BASI|nr:hypothetical protein CROQUDRAFT_35117 [Cronartium quercuum f. sp. fusiforme G11]